MNYKMTDLQRFLELYRSFGIELKPVVDGPIIIIKMDSEDEFFDGNPYHFSKVIFDRYGKFITQGFWEF